MAALDSVQRKALESAVIRAREAAETACRAALDAFGVEASEPPASLSDEGRQLRRALRARQRQLAGSFEQLLAGCAYEQWHLMLFARFLAENDLLMYPGAETAVTMDEVRELASDEGEDPWLLAASFARQMLPGVFRPDDPCVRLPLAAEGRRCLEDILAGIAPEVFAASDALGWVYQFWQTKKKKEVNASERKIGGADLAPVTQLFTEHYMVRFLLENSLGAWWAARHPESPLLASFEYLRYADDDTPAAGRFEGWPESVAEVTVMDPCCGSGHFLVAAFQMLRKMREDEEGLSMGEAADAVLRDNLCGLELDARCIQLAAFALALTAWKVAGYHELPALNLACSGIPTRGGLEEWTQLAKGDQRLERALTRLHELFREGDTLGSLIDPRRAVEDDTLMSVPFEEVAPLLEQAMAKDDDPVAAVFGESAREVAKAATLLAGSYTLVATNVPYLGRGKQSEGLRAYLEREHADAKQDLAMAFLERVAGVDSGRSTVALVIPESWLVQATYRKLRAKFLSQNTICCAAFLGEEGFESFGIRGPRVMLTVLRPSRSGMSGKAFVLDATTQAGEPPVLIPQKIVHLLHAPGALQSADNPRLGGAGETAMLEAVATSTEGLSTGDNPRYERAFWELDELRDEWTPMQASPDDNAAFDGCESVILWQGGKGALASDPGARIQGLNLFGCPGVLIGRMRRIRATSFLGGLFDKGCVVLRPKDPSNLEALYAYCTSASYENELRQVVGTTSVATATMLKVPFDLAHWQRVAAEQYPNGLPEPHSEDPTQWLFKGNIVGSEQPLHVALARLLAYRWPDQEPDELDALADEDGIVCLPAVAGERPAHERLRDLLTAAFGAAEVQATLDKLLAAEGARTLEAWLRDKAFASHARLFHNRPFLWQVWDGRADGFSAFLNYHGLGHDAMQKLTYGYLGAWIEGQQADDRLGVSGADLRLAAARQLQNQLALILEGEPSFDIYVRWKALAEQPLGWQPNLNDGVRLNVRPLVTAGVLRSKLSMNWNKDRGKNADGSERLNDLHFALAEKRAARGPGDGP